MSSSAWPAWATKVAADLKTYNDALKAQAAAERWPGLVVSFAAKSGDYLVHYFNGQEQWVNLGNASAAAAGPPAAAASAAA